MIYRPVNKSHGKHMVGKVHSIPASVQCRSKKRDLVVAWMDEDKA